jgi:hypothetical protein
MVESQEFSIFIDHSGPDLEKRYKNRRAETASEIYTKFQKARPIELSLCTTERRAEYSEAIFKFTSFISQSIMNMGG